jgi:hypothetical protein
MDGGYYSFEIGPPSNRLQEGLPVQKYAVKVKLTATVCVRAPNAIVARSCPSRAAIGQPQVTQFEDWYKREINPHTVPASPSSQGTPAASNQSPLSNSRSPQLRRKRAGQRAVVVANSHRAVQRPARRRPAIAR